MLTANDFARLLPIERDMIAMAVRAPMTLGGALRRGTGAEWHMDTRAFVRDRLSESAIALRAVRLTRLGYAPDRYSHDLDYGAYTADRLASFVRRAFSHAARAGVL